MKALTAMSMTRVQLEMSDLHSRKPIVDRFSMPELLALYIAAVQAEVEEIFPNVWAMWTN